MNERQVARLGWSPSLLCVLVLLLSASGSPPTAVQHHTPALLELDARRNPSAAERRVAQVVVRRHVGWHRLSSRMTMRARPQAWFVAELVGERLLVS